MQMRLVLFFFYLRRLWSPPRCEESGRLVRSHADDELPLGVPAQVLDGVEVTRYDDGRPPLSLLTQRSVHNPHPVIPAFPSLFTSAALSHADETPELLPEISQPNDTG